MEGITTMVLQRDKATLEEMVEVVACVWQANIEVGMSFKLGRIEASDAGKLPERILTRAFSRVGQVR
jgi:hypothetical protein